MEEDKIKLILGNLIGKIILPKYPFLKLNEILGPSESVTPYSANFYVFFTSSKESDFDEHAQIRSDVKTLFNAIGLPDYDSHGTRYGIRTIFD